MKKSILVVLSLFLFVTNLKAITLKGCESSEIARMKAYVSNINISYDYHMEDVPVFRVTISNIIPGTYFVDSNTKITYYYWNTNNGEITIDGYRNKNSGSYKFYSVDCGNIFLGSKYYSFPIYNKYYNAPICEDINLKVCNKWGSKSYSESEIKKTIAEYEKATESQPTEEEEYKKTTLDKIIDFYVKYYYYILSFIIVVCSIIIFIKRRKDKFNLKI